VTDDEVEALARELIASGEAWDERPGATDTVNRRERAVTAAADYLGMSTFDVVRGLQTRRYAGADWPEAVGMLLDR